MHKKAAYKIIRKIGAALGHSEILVGLATVKHLELDKADPEIAKAYEIVNSEICAEMYRGYMLKLLERKEEEKC